MIKKFEEFINESYGHNLLQELYKNANPDGKKLLKDISEKEMESGIYILLCKNSEYRNLKNVLNRFEFDLKVEGSDLYPGEFSSEIKNISHENPKIYIKDFNRLNGPVFDEVMKESLNKTILGTINVDDDELCDHFEEIMDKIQTYKL